MVGLFSARQEKLASKQHRIRKHCVRRSPTSGIPVTVRHGINLTLVISMLGSPENRNTLTILI